MSDAADETEVGAAPEGEAPATTQDAQPSKFEAAARSGGWVPKEQFKGDPEKWLEAEDFVLKAAEILPHVTKELREARGEIKGVQKTLADFAEHHSKTELRAYQRALKELETQIEQAASIGDVAGVKAATNELIELQKDATPAPKAAQGEPPEFTSWKEKNPWFGEDEALTAATVAIANKVEKEGYSGAAHIREVDKRLKEKFPQLFENPARKQAAPVEGGQSAPKPRGKTYTDLPAEAKAACDDFVKRGLLTREVYVRDYFQ